MMLKNSKQQQKTKNNNFCALYLYATGWVGVSQPAKKNGRCVERREE
jgi:hypothetical protein